MGLNCDVWWLCCVQSPVSLSVLDHLVPLSFDGQPVTFAEVTYALHNRVTLPASAPWALYWLTSGLRIPADSSFCAGFLFFPGSPLCPLQRNLRKLAVTRKLICFCLSMIPSVSKFPTKLPVALSPSLHESANTRCKPKGLSTCTGGREMASHVVQIPAHV